jgi:8-oxo-dGTP pyrophosphatase MutT (NUDIX family)
MGDYIFVFEGRNELKDETYYQPLGGAVGFGEYTQLTLQREFQEEIGTAIENLRFLKVVENMFTLEGC